MPDSNPTGARRACEYCGLPMGAGGFEPQPGHYYCCYGCYLVQGILSEQDEAGVSARVLARLGVGSFLSMTVMMVSLLLYTNAPAAMTPEAIRAMRWTMLLFSTPALVIMGTPFLRSAWHELRHRRLNTDALIAMGSLSAYGVSAGRVLADRGTVYFDTATMLLVLVTVGRLLEASAKSNTAKLVRGLLALGPRVAHRVTAAGEEDVAPEALRPGDRIAVRPGEQVPVDGVVLEGRSAVEESAFTGEALPRHCTRGDTVYGGSINTDGRLLIEATGVGEHTLLGQMARLVREAQSRRAPAERLADRLATIFVPLVWALAGTAAVYWLARGGAVQAGMAALSVLVVACPCALGLATPLAVSLGIGRAARAGVLVRSGETLELLPRIRRLFVDKTGTLTRGMMAVERIELLDPELEPTEALAWAASLETAAEHPTARALVAAARERNLPLGEVSEFQAVPGYGAAGSVTRAGQTRPLLIGTRRLMEAHGAAFSPGGGEATPDTHSEIYLAWEGRVRACFALTDQTRPDAAALVAALAESGIQTTLLSGDREPVARRVAEQLGIPDVRGECTPTEKVATIEAARKPAALVAMMGDGINDAPSLAAADIGIALAGGTDLAREAGDVVLLGNELGRLPWVIALARETRRIITQNLLWAFGYNTLALAVAFTGRLHPLLAAVLMLISSFFVLGNSLRLMRWEPARPTPQPEATASPLVSRR